LPKNPVLIHGLARIFRANKHMEFRTGGLPTPGRFI